MLEIQWSLHSTAESCPVNGRKGEVGDGRLWLAQWIIPVLTPRPADCLPRVRGIGYDDPMMQSLHFHTMYKDYKCHSEGERSVMFISPSCPCVPGAAGQDEAVVVQRGGAWPLQRASWSTIEL